jgi:hypothetical protein
MIKAEGRHIVDDDYYHYKMGKSIIHFTDIVGNHAGLQAEHAGLVDVLPLRAGAAGRQGAEDRGNLRGVGDRDVGDGILDPVMEDAGFEGQPVRGLPFERAFEAVEALGIEAGVGLGEVVADPERPVEFIERRQAEAGAGGEAENQVAC